MPDKCAVKGCKKRPTLIYYGYDVCSRCWKKHAKGTINLKKLFNITSPVRKRDL